MRITKALGLAALAAVTAMAFIGTGSAVAQNKIVLCTELQTTCSNGKLWSGGTKLLLLAKDPELIGTLPVKCEDSTGVVETNEDIGSPLNFKITSLKFGKLPSPEGTGCTNCEALTSSVPVNGSIEVEATDRYFFKSEISITGEKCTVFKVKCVFKGTIRVEIKHDGEHPNHQNTTILPLITFEKTLTRTEGSEPFCGNTTTWKASYVLYLADPTTGEPGLAWPSLDK